MPLFFKTKKSPQKTLKNKKQFELVASGVEEIKK